MERLSRGPVSLAQAALLRDPLGRSQAQTSDRVLHYGACPALARRCGNSDGSCATSATPPNGLERARSTIKPRSISGVVKVSEVIIANLRGHFRSMMHGPRAFKERWPSDRRTSYAYPDPRAARGHSAGGRIADLGRRCHPGVPTALWSPAVAAFLGSPSWLRHTV
jgi:hypothetical protein